MTPSRVAAAAPPSPKGWMTTALAVIVEVAVVVLSSRPRTRTLVPLRTAPAGPPTIPVVEVSAMLTTTPVAVVMVKPEAEVAPTMPVAPPSAGPDNDPPPPGGVVAAPAVAVVPSTSTAEASPAAASRPSRRLGRGVFVFEDPIGVEGAERWVWVCSSGLFMVGLLSGTAEQSSPQSIGVPDPEVRATQELGRLATAAQRSVRIQARRAFHPPTRPAWPWCASEVMGGGCGNSVLFHISAITIPYGLDQFE